MPTWLSIRPSYLQVELWCWLRARRQNERCRCQDHCHRQHQHGQIGWHQCPLNLQEHWIQQVCSGVSIPVNKNLFRNISGINATLDLKTGLKGLSALAATNIGLGFDKNGYQLGVTGTIPNLAAPSFTNAKYSIGFAGCPHFQVSLSVRIWWTYLILDCWYHHYWFGLGFQW